MFVNQQKAKNPSKNGQVLKKIDISMQIPFFVALEAVFLFP